jgi:hypothetical protein
VALDKLTLKTGTYTHEASSTLDPKNRGTKLLLGKGFQKTSAFVYDVFPLRVSTSTKLAGKSNRKRFPQYNDNHDKLLEYYLNTGGKVTLVMGTKALEGFTSYFLRENIVVERINPVTQTGYTVFLERSKVYLPHTVH